MVPRVIWGHRMTLRPRPEEAAAPRPLPIVKIDHAFVPRGLRREAAAWYVGVSPSTFDEWVGDGTMPTPKKKNGVVLWDRLALDAAIEALPDRDTDKKADPYADIGP